MQKEAVLRIGNVRNRLGEGSLWHPGSHRLFWFDILEGRLHWCNAEGGAAGVQQLGRMASAAAWVDCDVLLLAAEDGIYRYRISDGAMTRLATFPENQADSRSNDGRCDPWGRFWISTMDKAAAPGRGALYILDHNLELHPIKMGLTVPNSIAFSPDRRHAYFADSAAQTIFVFELAPDTGRILSERIFATTAGDVEPDGSVVDAEGHLWNAQWNGWRIVRYRPDGEIDRTIELPIRRPTCPAFGGAALRTLYVTSASEGLSLQELREQPGAGGLWAIRLNVQGVPEPSFQLAGKAAV